MKENLHFTVSVKHTSLGTMVGKGGKEKFCERLTLPDCGRLGRKEGNAEGGIPEKRQGR